MGAVLPENKGKIPAHERVDLLFRNGQVRRDQDPTKWRWRPFDFESDWDIVRWQPSLSDPRRS